MGGIVVSDEVNVVVVMLGQAKLLSRVMPQECLHRSLGVQSDALPHLFEQHQQQQSLFTKTRRPHCTNIAVSARPSHAGKMTYSRPGSYSSADFLKGLQALRMHVVDPLSRHSTGWQQGFFQLACVGIGVLAVSTLLVGGFLWDYIHSKYKKDRRPSPTCECADVKQSGGRHARRFGGKRKCDSVAHVEKTAFRQPSRSAPDMRCAFQEQDAEEYFTQVLAEARESATEATKSSESAILDMTTMPISSTGLTSTLYFPKSPSYNNQHEIDLDYLEYERHVKVKARELQSDGGFAPGGRHAWKSIMFWKRDTKVRGMRAYVRSAAATPVHPSRRTAVYNLSTPCTPIRQIIRPSNNRRGSSGPLYTDDFSKLPPEHWSNRPEFGPVTGLKVIMPRKDDCYMSPYVPLNRTERIASGPLYVV